MSHNTIVAQLRVAFLILRALVFSFDFGESAHCSLASNLVRPFGLQPPTHNYYLDFPPTQRCHLFVSSSSLDFSQPSHSLFRFSIYNGTNMSRQTSSTFVPFTVILSIFWHPCALQICLRICFGHWSRSHFAGAIDCRGSSKVSVHSYGVSTSWVWLVLIWHHVVGACIWRLSYAGTFGC